MTASLRVYMCPWRTWSAMLFALSVSHTCLARASQCATTDEFASGSSTTNAVDSCASVRDRSNVLLQSQFKVSSKRSVFDSAPNALGDQWRERTPLAADMKDAEAKVEMAAALLEENVRALDALLQPVLVDEVPSSIGSSLAQSSKAVQPEGESTIIAADDGNASNASDERIVYVYGGGSGPWPTAVPVFAHVVIGVILGFFLGIVCCNYVLKPYLPRMLQLDESPRQRDDPDDL